MGQLPPKSKFLLSAYHSDAVNAINVAGEMLNLLPRIERLNANPTHVVPNENHLSFYAKLKPASYRFAMGFESRTLVLILVCSDNGLEVVISSGELSRMLSKRQQHILRFIHQHTLEHGFAPSIREISIETGITSTSVVNYNLERLITWGYLVKSRGKSRTLGLTERGSALLESNHSVQRKRTAETLPVSSPHKIEPGG